MLEDRLRRLRRNCAAADFFNFVGNFGEALGAAGEEHDIDAVLREFNRECTADAAGCSGDQCPTIFKLPFRHDESSFSCSYVGVSNKAELSCRAP